MKTSAAVYPLSALRALALYAQRLNTPNAAVSDVTPGAIIDLVSALGYVQIDTLQVVNRAHLLALWSRFGAYDTSVLHRLIYGAGERRLYEGWGHAASIIPLQHYRYHRWRSDATLSFNPGYRMWLSKQEHRDLAAQTLARIRADGAQRLAAFSTDAPRRGEWYDWSPSKLALEVLFAQGELMVADRANFQRVYDVTERVLPAWVDTTPVDADAARRFCLEQAALALGVFQARHLTLYAYMRATPARALVAALIQDGTVVAVQGESTRGIKQWLVHRDTLPLLERAADGDFAAQRTTFLNPFDSLFWAWDRDRDLWGFEQVLECYKPAAQRVYGYFSMPILHKDRLVGRFDPKLDRRAGVLHLLSLRLEPGVAPDEELIAAVGSAMRDFMSWHGARSLQVHLSDPRELGDKLPHAL